MVARTQDQAWARIGSVFWMMPRRRWKPASIAGLWIGVPEPRVRVIRRATMPAGWRVRFATIPGISRVRAGSALGREDPGDRVGALGVRAEPVHGLGREGDQATAGEHAGGVGDVGTETHGEARSVAKLRAGNNSASGPRS